MSTKSSIVKVHIDLSNIDQHRYETLRFTVALGDQESTAHFILRLLAYAMIPEQKLSFGHELNSSSEPDLMVKDYNDRYIYWVDAGFPRLERIKKATHQADMVYIFSLNDSPWLQENRNELMNMQDVHLILFEPAVIELLSLEISRTLVWSMVIDGDKIGISSDENYVETTITRINSSRAISRSPEGADI